MKTLRRDPLVRGLGLASAALGVPQVARPADVAQGIGVTAAPGSARPPSPSASANWRRRAGCWPVRTPSGCGAGSAATSST